MFSPKPGGVETSYQRDAAQVTPDQSQPGYKLGQITLENENERECTQKQKLYLCPPENGLQPVATVYKG